MKYTHVLLALGAALTAGLIYATPTLAADTASCSVLPQAICDSSTADTQDDPSKSGIFQLLIWIMRIMTGVVGIAAIGALVYAGILYGSSSGQSAQITKAKTIITDVVIGLVAYGFMFIILNWLIPGGIFG